MNENQIQETGEAHGMPQHVIDDVKKQEGRPESEELIEEEANRVEEEKAAEPELPINDEAKDVGGVAGQRLRAFIERIERLEEEKANIAEDIKEVYAEAKGVGFDAKTMRKIVSLRKVDTEKRREAEELLDLYKSAIGMV